MTVTTTAGPGGPPVEAEEDLSPAPVEEPLAAPADTARGVTLLGTVLLVAAEAMALGAIVAVYFGIKGGAPRWPPRGVRLGTYLVTVVTVTAVMSGFCVRWALYAIRRNDLRNTLIGLALAVGLGLAMANAEWYSFSRARFGVARHAYGSLYYTLIGFHLFHLLAAIGLLVVMTGRTLVGHFASDRHEPLRASVLFWQFGNVAWFVVLIVLYVMSRHH